MNEQNKPLIVRMEEAKKELTQCVNDVLQKHAIGCYLIEPVFADIYMQIKVSAQNELAQAKSQMEAANAASDNTK